MNGEECVLLADFKPKLSVLEMYSIVAGVPKNLTAYETQILFTQQGPYLPALCVEVVCGSSDAFHFLFEIASHWPRISSG